MRPTHSNPCPCTRPSRAWPHGINCLGMGRTVLIVDDEAGTREVLQRILESGGYEIVQAESGSQAIALAGTLQVDAFLLDIDMPRMNGMDLCRALRSIETYATTPIIFLTGATDDAVLEAA